MVEEFTWADFDHAVDELVLRLATLRASFANVYGIPRGGLVLATVLSHRLSLPYAKRVTQRTLVVDDISDSGRVLKPYKAMGCTLATLHIVPYTTTVPDIWARVRKGTWIIYPWEVGSSTDRRMLLG
jgi:hypoxanthine phosphoribosyltransferase